MKLSSYSIFIFFLVVAYLINLSSCISTQEIVYFQDQNRDTTFVTGQEYNTVFQRDDILTITISALDIESVVPFNMQSFGGGQSVAGRQQLLDYLIDSDGNIDFPVLGKISLVGLNRSEATKLIKGKLKIYIKDPIVIIRLINFKVTVLGEVNSPGSYTVPNEIITLPEALGLAGDLTIFGERSNVLVIREMNGIQTKVRIDLTTDEVFVSPFYYLSQNDIIYVEPRKTKIRDASFGAKTTSIIFSVVSTAISIVALLVVR